MAAGRRVRQFLGALTARVQPEEQRVVEDGLSESQRALFRAMRANDQRHALDVRDRLHRAGARDPYLLQAALLHDAGKARIDLGLAPRVAAVLLRRLDRRLIDRLARPDGRHWRRALWVQANHPAIGAALAADAGSHPTVVRLILEHEQLPRDGLARALRVADEEG